MGVRTGYTNSHLDLADVFILASPESVVKKGEALLQPIVAAHNGQVAGFEALLRQKMPDNSFKDPADLLRETAEHHQGHDLFMHMLEHACKAVHRARRTGLNDNFFISINADAEVLGHRCIAEETLDVLSMYQVDPHQIKVELIEQCLPGEFLLASARQAPAGRLEQRARIVNALYNFQQGGIRIMLDDAYALTGFNNDVRIHELLVDAYEGGYNLVSGVKIDRDKMPSVSEVSVEDTVESLKSTVLYQHLQKLLQDEEAVLPDIVVEGVESEDDIAVCREVFAGMPLYYQSFAFHKPMRMDQAISLLPPKDHYFVPVQIRA